jgi:LysM repeat protein
VRFPHSQYTVTAAFPVNAISAGRSPLGAHNSTAFSRFARRVPVVAAAPALLGVGAALVMANAPAGHPAGHTDPGTGTSGLADVAAAPASTAVAAAPTATPSAPAATPKAPKATQVAAKPATAPTGKHSKPVKYTVKPGDTLASIAQQVYQSDAYWPALYTANHGLIQSPDAITVGQVLSVPAKPATIPAAPAVATPPPAAPTATTPSASTPSGGSTGTTTPPASTTTVSTAGYSSFQACVISRESGGNPQVMNASGHYGLYQFSESTWVAYGGAAADFGHASVAEQNQVFASAMAAGGESNWAPYDGC